MDGIVRIAVFYDGCYFTKAQKHFYGRGLGWLSFQPLHEFIENYIEKQMQGNFEYKVVYSAWYQGLHTSKNADESHLKRDRNRDHDLMHAGIETKFYPMSQNQTEKGIDVAMAIGAFEMGISGIFDVAVLITGDGDFVPLARGLMKHSLYVMNLYFEFEENGHKSFSNSRLKEACSYQVNFNSLE